ncbi:conserved membrane hypothetical protein [uncultured delta proteobacterium]|uniref:Cytosine permease n=1 Tax=uncultured delta proteobacterium TaxID=34034 RepID=A0A212KCA6_9DELT|nr:conserved membrane hypothetical protein [uncultured delta proteobacterium]
MTDVTKTRISGDTEFTLMPVPISDRRATWKQILVWIGFGYVVTGLFVGGVLAGFGGQPGVSYHDALWSIALGMGALFILTSLLGVASQRTGFNLALLSRYSYGARGANIVMLVMALLTLGWFSSITGMVGQIWGSFLGNVSGITVFDPAAIGRSGFPAVTLEEFLSCVVFGIIFTYTAALGIKGLELIAIPVAPAILIIALWVGGGMLAEGGGYDVFVGKANQLGGLGMGTAITAVVGSWIAGAIMGCDLFRFNRNIPAVFLCAAACFIITNPLLNIIGYMGSISVGQFNYVAWMLKQGLGLAILGVIAWTLSLWTTNDGELYCNALYTRPFLHSYGLSVTKNKLVFGAGILGTILGALGFYQLFFNTFITVLGTVAPPLAGPIIADYFIVRKKYVVANYNRQPLYRSAGIASFLAAAVLALILQYAIIIPNLPSGLLSLVVAIALYPVLYSITADSAADRELGQAPVRASR